MRHCRAGRVICPIPTPANVLIKQDNPKMTDDQIAFAIKTMKEIKLLNGDAAATQGIGIMTDARWKATLRLPGEGRSAESLD